ncbi:MAG: type II toxin-antitoxin system RelE/ParE family toxin [Candidatus Hydrogenedentes bacterium]|nr:type II toxin-antitoxin system RelE/ParE family toxin [Candidatus Hydrogenedentota bacterium]
MKVEWSPLAERRAREIAGYIAEHNISAARRWLRRLLAAVARLDRFPRRGKRLPLFKRIEIRQVWVGMYRVIYLVEADRVTVLTVRHGMRRESRRELRTSKRRR